MTTIHSSSSKSPTPAGKRPGSSPATPPPEWAAERIVKTIGKVPAAAGRFLDRLAKTSFPGPIVRLFSSVWFGIIILSLMACYIAFGSGFASVRARMEMTDLQFFDWWPMQLLLMLLVLDLSIVTLRKIPLTLFKLGPWMVHIGILTLIAGCVWYFSLKQEGSVRLYLNKPTSVYYDVTERALYAFPQKPDGSFDVDHTAMTPLPTLPIYYERLEKNGNPLDMPVPGALSALGDRFKNASVRVRGYYPSALMQTVSWRDGQPGETGEGPAIAMVLSTSTQRGRVEWLLSKSPATRLMESDALPISFEYLYHPSPLRVRDLQTSFDGPIGLTVRIPKLNIDRTYSVKPGGAAIDVEGSPYTLKVPDPPLPGMPMASKGYEKTSSSALTVSVSRKAAGDRPALDFQRMALFRYPERSPDFVTEGGKQVRKQDGVDPDIQIIFHDAAQAEVWIVEAEDGGLSLIYRSPQGKSTTQPFTNKPVSLPIEELPTLKLELAQRAANAVAVMAPAIIPPEQRPRAQTAMDVMQLSVIDVEVSSGPWKREHLYVPFSPFAQISDPPEGKPPTVVDIPNVGTVGLLLGTTRRDLPSTVTLTDFKPVKFPGALHAYADYVSTLKTQERGAAPSAPGVTLQPHLNDPATDHGLYYFQAAWDGDDNAPPDKRFSVIGVANRPGIPLMVAGAILMILGIGYAFYAKPILLKLKKESLVAWNAARTKAA